MLFEVSQNATVRLLLSREIDKIPTPRTTKEAIDKGIPLVVVQKVTGNESILYALEMELAKVMVLVNVDSRLNIQSSQTRIIAETILEQFGSESFEDFKLAFARGSCGFYGEIYRIDGAVIVRWIQCYLMDKYTIVDSIVHQAKGPDKDAQVDYKAFQTRLEEQRAKQKQEHEAELEEKRFAAENFTKGLTPKGYKPQTKEQVVEREIHNLWIRHNFDRLGKKTETWKDEDSWIAENEEMIKRELS